MKSIKCEKIPELVGAAASAIDLDQELTAKLIDKIKDDLPEDDVAEQAPKQKQQYAVLVSDPEGLLEGKALVAWVLTLPESESPYTANERTQKAASDFNCSKKGRRLPVKTIGETFEGVPAKYFKEHGLTVKTKVAVTITTTDNSLRETPSV